ncbi:hypothetical protein [Nocardia sp. NBC_00511]|uniref:hypothetical protein n=1 Tax=Nocardia sp. NBC_00511 TaxID=2903591 RepID=UPI0030E2E0B7
MTDIDDGEPIVLDHRMWQLLEHAVPLVRAAGSTQMGIQHLLLALLHDPNLIPAAELRAMRLHPATVFGCLAGIAARRTEATRNC